MDAAIAADKFEEAAGEMTPEELGASLYASKGCIGCHSLDGAAIIGPSFKGLYGKTETLVDESTVVVDDSYIKESIQAPQAKLVKGFPTPMTDMGVSDDEVAALTAYIKTLK